MQITKKFRNMLEDFVASLVRGCVARGVRLDIEQTIHEPSQTRCPGCPR